MSTCVTVYSCSCARSVCFETRAHTAHLYIAVYAAPDLSTGEVLWYMRAACVDALEFWVLTRVLWRVQRLL